MSGFYQTRAALFEQISRFEPDADSMLKRMQDAPEIVIIVPPSASSEAKERAGLIGAYAATFRKPVKIFGYSSEAGIYTSHCKKRPFVYNVRTEQPELLENMKILADTCHTIVLYPNCDEAHSIKMHLLSENSLNRHVLVLSEKDAKASKSSEVEIFDAPFVYSLLRGPEKDTAGKNLGRIRLVSALKRRSRSLA